MQEKRSADAPQTFGYFFLLTFKITMASIITPTPISAAVSGQMPSTAICSRVVLAGYTALSTAAVEVSTRCRPAVYIK